MAFQVVFGTPLFVDVEIGDIETESCVDAKVIIPTSGSAVSPVKQ